MVDVAASSNLEENTNHPNGVFIYSVCCTHLAVDLTLCGGRLVCFIRCKHHWHKAAQAWVPQWARRQRYGYYKKRISSR